MKEIKQETETEEMKNVMKCNETQEMKNAEIKHNSVIKSYSSGQPKRWQDRKKPGYGRTEVRT